MTSKILITGITGCLGRNLLDYLETLSLEGYTFRFTHYEKVSLEMYYRLFHISSDIKMADLTNLDETERVVRDCDTILHMANPVYGIQECIERPADIYDLITTIDTNLLKACSKLPKKPRIVWLGSGAGYGPDATDEHGMVSEDKLLKTQPNSTALGYGSAKKQGYVLLQNYGKQYGIKSVYLALTTVFGKYQNFGLDGMFIPATITKFFTQPEIVVWGSGKPVRDFILADEIVRMIWKFVENFECSTEPEVVNLSGEEGLSVREIVGMIRDITNYQGNITYDTSKNDGMIVRMLDSGKLHRLYPEFTPKGNYKDKFCEQLKEIVSWARGIEHGTH